MTVVGIVIIFTSALCFLAYRANVRFRNEDWLPMQWSLTGNVNWSAPRRLALAFIPGLATVILVVFAVTSRISAPRAGQEGEVIPTMIGLGAMFIAVQMLHLYLIARTLARNPR